MDLDEDYGTSRLYHTETQLEDDGFVDGCLQVRAHFEYAEHVKSTQKVYALSDSGADSCVAGMGAKILSYTGRYAHLIGYDPTTTRSGRIPICSLYIKAKAHNGIPVLLLLHEAPCNITSPVTLISEYQVREYGLVIDSVASKHKIGETTFGTQRFQVNDAVHIPFEDRGGLMGFEILPYEEGDDRIYDIIPITQSTKWIPGRFRKPKEDPLIGLPDFDAILQTSSSSQMDKTPAVHVIPDLLDVTIHTIPDLLDKDTHFRANICNECHPTFDAFHVLTSTWEDPSNDEHPSDLFLGHLQYAEIVGQERCNTEYYGYPASYSEDYTNEDIFSSGDTWGTLAFKATRDPQYEPDTNAYAVKSWHRIIHSTIDPKRVQPFLGWRPLQVIRKTLECTTQLARMALRIPLQRHMKARFPWMNVRRLDEAVSVDPMFANCRSMSHGFTGGYIFMGVTSRYLNMYGFRSKGRNFPAILRDFYRHEGAPSVLRTDNGKDLASGDVKSILREFMTKEQFSEDYNPQQNPVESGGVKWVKNATHVLLDRTGAPDTAWFLAAQYLCNLHNVLWSRHIDTTPYKMRRGITPDISSFLQFCFWERILYLDHEQSYPDTKERSGYWVGVADHIGDALTYWVIDDQSGQLHARSVVRPYNANLRVKWDPAFAGIPLKHTAKNGGDERLQPLQERESILRDAEDAYDKDEAEPLPHPIHSTLLPKKIKKGTPFRNLHVDEGPGEELIVPRPKEDPYSGESRVRFGNEEMEQDGEIHVPYIKAKAKHKETSYKHKFVPPEIDDEIDDSGEPQDDRESQRAVKLGQDPPIPRKPPDPPNPSPEPLRRSTRIRTVFRPSRMRKALTMFTAMVGVTFFPNSVYAEPIRGMNEAPIGPGSQDISFTPIDEAESAEKLRVYHAQLDRMNDMMEQDPETEDWKVHEIKGYRTRHVVGKGTELLFEVVWKNKERSLIPMESLRLHDPWAVSKYGFANNLTHQRGWEWVTHYIDQDHNLARMVNAYKVSRSDSVAKYKFGVEVPRNPKHAIEIDNGKGTTGWKTSIEKEIKQLDEFRTFKVIPDNEPTPSGYKRIPYHLVFDVKFDGRLKSRLVAGGHRTPEVPKEEVFSPVVSMEAVRLGFFMARLNDLQVCAGDVGNAFLNAYTREKVFIIAGPEFGPELEGKRLIIDRSLYGLKTSAARFHEHLSVKLRLMNYYPSKADPDLWVKQCEDGHFEYIARYVDDVISFSRDPMAVMNTLEEHYTMKGVGRPQYYLGGDVQHLTPDWEKEGIQTAFSAHTYINEVAPKLADLIKKDKSVFAKKSVPMHPDYHPEMDDSELLSPQGISVYRSFIGSANWVITLGRFDICYALNSLSRYLVAPRKGHLDAMIYLFGYLLATSTGKIAIDIGDPPIRKKAFYTGDATWSEFYQDTEEDIPYDLPQSDGNVAKLTTYVDADHARDKLSRKSVTGIIMLLNNTPLFWLSKRQMTVETSTYGSEMIAARIAVDNILAMRYKLRMLGVNMEETSVMVGDNMSVVLSTTLPSSSLKKKHLACNYHRVREAVAGRIIDFGHIDTKDNLADIMTKPLSAPNFYPLMNKYIFRNSLASNHEYHKPPGPAVRAFE